MFCFDNRWCTMVHYGFARDGSGWLETEYCSNHVKLKYWICNKLFLSICLFNSQICRLSHNNNRVCSVCTMMLPINKIYPFVRSLRSRIWLCFPPGTITTIIIITPTQILQLCTIAKALLVLVSFELVLKISANVIKEVLLNFCWITYLVGN